MKQRKRTDSQGAGSTIITSNKGFESWGDDFPDAVIASAVLDRLVHHAHLIPIVGDSYRMKDHKASGQKGGTDPKNRPPRPPSPKGVTSRDRRGVI